MHAKTLKIWCSLGGYIPQKKHRLMHQYGIFYVYQGGFIFIKTRINFS